MIYCVVKAICKWFKEKEAFYFEKGGRFPDEIVSFLFFSIQNRTNLALIKFYYNHGVILHATMQQFDVFWKLLENLQGNDYSEWLVKVSSFQISCLTKFQS